ncbi:NAD-dependent epimerase/dehydratase family protein [Ancylobacter sp. Lp-2]|uniref:NAD-dependent epimerase/dehydratase family protein n=1 Tax=Ancylobacter sp. Lp-2 TaxID=2881339 RepID=UPI001E615A19|nr:NAD-dependent epimerase/dehydratase family protein [Ancylobacter sp. Lp-2]MCB4769831.1 NAD-dependent epimerase/dehydratase family protein [Ancylobacter sp. Lp-2]
MTALVIGARGFLGTALCRELVRQGVPLKGTVFRGHSTTDGPFPIHRVDLAKTSHKVFCRLLEDVDTVYHLAWSSIPQTATADPLSDLRNNVVGLVKLLEAVRKRPDVRVVFASSGGAVYGPARYLPIDEGHPTSPVSAYGASKLAAENYLAFYAAQYEVNSVSLRISNAYGTGQNIAKGLGAVTAFTHAAIEGRPITIYGDGSTLRDYVWVDDVVSALIAAGRRRDVTGPVNVGSGVGSTLLSIIDELEHHLRARPNVIMREARRFDVPASQLDIRLAEDRLGWKPAVNLHSGIDFLCSHFQSLLPLRAAQ